MNSNIDVEPLYQRTAFYSREPDTTYSPVWERTHRKLRHREVKGDSVASSPRQDRIKYGKKESIKYGNIYYR